MGFFDDVETTPEPVVTQPQTPPAPVVDHSAPTKVSLAKNQSVSLAKAQPGATVTLRCQWPDKTDYDLMALVEYADGHVEHVATFPARGVTSRTSTQDGVVRHAGDQSRGDGGASGLSSETIEIIMNPAIRTIVPVVYSAQSNGQGSFRKYGVTSIVECGNQIVTIPSENASRNPTVYSLVPAVVTFDGTTAQVENVEMYSRMGNENRPDVRHGKVSMNTGARNEYK